MSNQIEELRSIANRYCQLINAELLFVKEDSFGFMTENEQLVHMYFDELEEVLNI